MAIGDPADSTPQNLYIRTDNKAAIGNGGQFSFGTAFTFPMSGMQKAVSTWSGTVVSGSSNGSVAETGAQGADWTASALGIGYGNAPSWGAMRNVHIFTGALSAGAQQKITS